MKSFIYHVCWRYSNENFCHGIVWATDEFKAKEILNTNYPNNIEIDVRELKMPENQIEEIYQK